jgi:hypothetical protein
MYRYRLAETETTEGLSSFILEGHRLWKTLWLMSDSPIDFKAHRGLIIEEQADSREEFDRRDEMDKNTQPPDVDDAPPPSVSPVEPAPSRLAVPRASRSSKKEPTAKISLRSRGFSDQELRGRSEEELDELLAFDQIISGKKR